MAISRINEDLNIISRLPDEPNDQAGMTAQELKMSFDKAGITIKNYINTVLLPELEKTGGDSIGMTEIPGVRGANLRSAIEYINKRLTDAVLGQIHDGSIDETKLKPGLVGYGAIPNDSIESTKLKNLSVTGEKIADLAVDTGKIADFAVTEQKLADDSVGETKLQKFSVSEDKLAYNSVSCLKLMKNAVQSNNIAPLSVTEEKIADNSVGYAKLKPGAVGGNRLRMAGEGFFGGVQLKPAPKSMKKYAGIDDSGYVRYDGITVKELWRRDGGAAFSPQTIAVGTEGDYLLIEYLSPVEGTVCKMSEIISKAAGEGVLKGCGEKSSYRRFKITESSLIFSEGKIVNSYGSAGAADNLQCMPCKISILK